MVGTQTNSVHSIVILSGLPKELCDVIFTFQNYNITAGDISASYNEIIELNMPFHQCMNSRLILLSLDTLF